MTCKREDHPLTPMIEDGKMLGEAGEPNHLVNMDRFEVVEWMTDKGIVKK